MAQLWLTFDDQIPFYYLVKLMPAACLVYRVNAEGIVN
jgi:hypothetical protein